MEISDRVNNKQHECMHKRMAGVTAASRLRHDFCVKIKNNKKEERKKTAKSAAAATETALMSFNVRYLLLVGYCFVVVVVVIVVAFVPFSFETLQLLCCWPMLGQVDLDFDSTLAFC